MKHICGLPSDTFILWKMSNKVKKAMDQVVRYVLITDNVPSKEMIEKLARECTEE